MTPAFHRVLTRERTRVGERWRDEMRRVYMADYDYSRAGMGLAIARDGRSPRELEWAEVDNAAAYRRWVGAVGRQMLVPAPGAAQLRWKRKHQGLDGGRPEWDAAISADVARLGGTC